MLLIGNVQLYDILYREKLTAPYHKAEITTIE